MAHAKAAILVFSSAAIGVPVTDLEKSYWDCEFMATRGQISLDAAADCSELYERLKKDRFGGNFEGVLAWWRENKGRELSMRAAQVRTRPDPRSAVTP